MHFFLLQDMLQYHMLLGRMTHERWVSLPLALLLQKQLVRRAVNQINNVIQAVSIAAWHKKG